MLHLVNRAKGSTHLGRSLLQPGIVIMARKKSKVASREGSPGDYSPSDESDVSPKAQLEEVVSRLPPLNSDSRPLPWKGRLGYACLNTVLRALREPVFCSRTCRIDTIKKEEFGMKHVLELGRKNAADLSGLIAWNEKFGIKFLRVSSEMFPFASHAEYGYHLQHAAAELKAAGALAMQYGHRLTTHPGQFTQLASPNKKVVEASFRDLEYHAELLTTLGLKDQSDRDAIMIIHMGGMFGDKEATLARFHENYAKLSDGVKRRLVLENDDVSWTVQDLLPTCQKLNIPLVLDWHHQNIMPGSLREGTLEILDYIPAITETWTRKGITPKQHYSEARDAAVTNHERRKHSARVRNLPPCANNMDLMIEAKDKEQAVFELAKLWNLTAPRVPDPIQPVSDPADRGEFEGYWPEGDEQRLKPPPLRRKKKVEIDENGEEVKTKPTRKTKVQKQDEAAEEGKGEEIKSKPSRRKTKVQKQDENAVDGIHGEDEINSENIKSKPSRRKIVSQKQDETAAEEVNGGEKKSKTVMRKAKAKKPDETAEEVKVKDVKSEPARKKRVLQNQDETAAEEVNCEQLNSKPTRRKLKAQQDEIPTEEVIDEPGLVKTVMVKGKEKKASSANDRKADEEKMAGKIATEVNALDQQEGIISKKRKVGKMVDNEETTPAGDTASSRLSLTGPEEPTPVASVKRTDTTGSRRRVSKVEEAPLKRQSARQRVRH